MTKSAAAGRSDIAAISGATISSQSVTDIVNKAVKDFREKLAAGTVKE